MFVVLEVDGSKGLVLGIESIGEEQAHSGSLRLALGGLLINNNKMIVQVGQFNRKGLLFFYSDEIAK